MIPEKMFPQISTLNFVIAVTCALTQRNDQKSGYLFPVFNKVWAEHFQNEKGTYFEGDIIMGNTSLAANLRAGSYNPRWKGGKIPYVFQQNIFPRGRQAIRGAMQDIEEKTCIRFKPRNTRRPEVDYVLITMYNEGCYSFVGRQGGRQQLNLGYGCWGKTTIIHELVHAVGFWHEQSRLDRDKWVTVQWNNIPRALWREFSKQPRLNNFNTEYDFRSVMHYSYNAFARNRYLPTIVPKRSYPWRLLGTGDNYGGLTKIDALQINRMYNCVGNELSISSNEIDVE